MFFVILYKYNSNICEHYYPNDSNINAWWLLRLKIYALMFCIPLFTNTIKIENNHIRLFEYIILGIISSDAIMFIVFNETEATFWDLFGTIIITIFGYYKIYLCQTKK